MFVKHYFFGLAKLTHALQMAEKIQRPEILASQSGDRSGPDLRGLLPAQRFAALRFDQLQTSRFRLAAQVPTLYIQRVRWQLRHSLFRRRAHSSASISPNFARKSGVALRTSSQSKKASGFSSQIRNHSPISFFSSRLRGSTLRFNEIISARRFPSRAISRTRSTAALSSCA